MCTRLLLAVVFLWLLITPTKATIRYVTESGAGMFSGTAWSDASNSIQDMIDVSIAGDTIWVAKGIYFADLLIDQDIILFGSLTGNESSYFDLSLRDTKKDSTVVQPNIGFHIFYLDGVSSSCVIDGFTIQGGRANGSQQDEKLGAGLFNLNASPTIRNCCFIDNIATVAGGAMYNDGMGTASSPLIEHCQFIENSANQGGAIYNSGDGGLSQPTIASCLFLSNEATLNGGAIVNFGANGVAKSEMYNSIFYGNEANQGGVCYNDCMGGNASVYAANCTFVLNGANTQGDVLYTTPNGDINSKSFSDITNSVIWNSTLPSSKTIYLDQTLDSVKVNLSFCLLEEDSCTEINRIGNSNIECGNGLLFNLDPLFLDENDLLGPDEVLGTSDDGLQGVCNSPILDEGTNSAGNGALDLARLSRIVGTIDLGAYEFQLSQFPANSTMVTNSRNSGCGTFRYAVSEADEKDTIQFSSNTNGQPIQLKTQVQIDKDLTIIGNDTSLTVLDGLKTSRVLRIPGTDSVYLQHIAIQNGLVAGSGAGIENRGILFLNHVAIVDNQSTASSGGGIASLDQGQITMKDCHVSRNQASSGGGIYLTGSGVNGISNSKIENNTCTSFGGGIQNNLTYLTIDSTLLAENHAIILNGGAIYTNQGIHISNSKILENQAPFGGGVHLSNSGETIISRCWIAGNVSEQGGGINVNGSAHCYISNSIISGNKSGVGGGILNFAYTEVVNSTITGNEATSNAGGIANSNDTVQLVNTIIALNTDPGIAPDFRNSDTIIDLGHNIIGHPFGHPFIHGENGNQVGSPGIVLDPQFLENSSLAPSIDGDFRVTCHSPAVHGGLADTTGLKIGSVDFTGQSRITGSKIDIGAHELTGALSGSERLMGDQSTDGLFIANGLIESSQVILSPAQVEYQTGFGVDLFSDFSILPGALLQVIIGNCME